MISGSGVGAADGFVSVPPGVMATIAAFIALGGVSYPALKLPKHSVGTKKLKKNAVTTVNIKNGAVTGEKVNLATLGKASSAANADHAGMQTTPRTPSTLSQLRSLT